MLATSTSCESSPTARPATDRGLALIWGLTPSTDFPDDQPMGTSMDDHPFQSSEETPEEGIGRAFLHQLLAVPEGRQLMLSISVDAEEGDESGIFDQLAELVDDPALRRVVETHRDDEVRH